MTLKFNKRVTVRGVSIKEGSLYSAGIGFDDNGAPVDFIGFTGAMKNIKTALDDFNDGDTDERPTIWLKPWQWDDTK